jgi:hypothetical protein
MGETEVGQFDLGITLGRLIEEVFWLYVAMGYAVLV